MQIKVSVLMPVLNGDLTHLGLAIDSILYQSFEHFEFVIVDDGSNEQTKQCLADYANKDSRIVLLSNNQNIGVGKSLNLGIKVAKGKYIARHDADDIAHKNRLEKQFEYMENNAHLAMSCTAVNHIDMQGKKVGGYGVSERSEDLAAELLLNSRLCHPTLMIKKSVLNEVGGYPITKRAQDYLLYLKLLEHSLLLGGLNEVLVDYRLNTQSITRKSRSKQLDVAQNASYEHVVKQVGELDKTSFIAFWQFVATEGKTKLKITNLIKLKKLLKHIKKDEFLYRAWAKTFKWVARNGLDQKLTLTNTIIAVYFYYLF